ncbi:hypothetical protein [Roseospira marina]|uniref:hypothetical protein n=1 Tax=Roseospira marina TaxID=140057 RepID=UPI00161B8B0D|nr:hypothetical protein [Roseospira marina]
MKIALYVNAAIVIFVALDPFGVFSSINIVSIVSISVAVLSLGVLALTQWVFPTLCRQPLMWRLFPDIDGDYDAEMSSNYPMLKAMADGHSTEELKTENLRLNVMGTVSIRTTLTNISMTFSAKNKYSTSEVLSCSLQRGRGNCPHRLYYVFEGRVKDPETTDTRSFLGAGCIDIPRERRPKVLDGEYWTNREWHNGLNTAGLVRFTRL